MKNNQLNLTGSSRGEGLNIKIQAGKLVKVRGQTPSSKGDDTTETMPSRRKSQKSSRLALEKKCSKKVIPSDSQRKIPTKPKKSSSKKKLDFSQETRSRNHSKLSRASSKSTQSINADKKLENYLKQENKQIQKQYMTCKSELYESNFKNKALKLKLEKSKQDCETQKLENVRKDHIIWSQMQALQNQNQLLFQIKGLLESSLQNPRNVQQAIQLLNPNMKYEFQEQLTEIPEESGNQTTNISQDDSNSMLATKNFNQEHQYQISQQLTFEHNRQIQDLQALNKQIQQQSEKQRMDYYTPSNMTEKRLQLRINTDANSTLTMQNIQQNIEHYSQQNSTSSKQSNKYIHHLKQLQNQLLSGNTGTMSSKQFGFTLNEVPPQEQTYGIGTFEKNQHQESMSQGLQTFYNQQEKQKFILMQDEFIDSQRQQVDSSKSQSDTTRVKSNIDEYDQELPTPNDYIDDPQSVMQYKHDSNDPYNEESQIKVMSNLQYPISDYDNMVSPHYGEISEQSHKIHFQPYLNDDSRQVSSQTIAKKNISQLSRISNNSGSNMVIMAHDSMENSLDQEYQKIQKLYRDQMQKHKKSAELEQNQSEINDNQGTHSQSTSRPSQHRPNMFDNVTNTLTTLTSNTNTAYTKNENKTTNLLQEINNLDKEINHLTNTMNQCVFQQKYLQ